MFEAPGDTDKPIARDFRREIEIGIAERRSVRRDDTATVAIAVRLARTVLKPFPAVFDADRDGQPDIIGAKSS